YQKYRRHILALISDIKFPRQGELDDEAGFKLVAQILEDNPGLPILLQSANPDIEKRARAIGCHFADKKSPLLLRTIRHFLKETLGFGDFVFRLPDRTEIARARDMYELEQVLRTVDARSLYYHASNNHFNVWLRARSMFDLADEVQKVQASDFADVEELRACLVELIHRKAQEEQEGVVADFSTRDIGPARPFVRLGKGSIGGKGRGLAFLHSLLARSGLPDAYPGLRILIPRTVVIATDEFDRFLEANGLDSVHAAHLPAEELRRRFLESELPEKLVLDLKAATADLRGPLAVRSSSLLEDSQHQSCAGVYDTCIVANNSPEPEVRWRELSRAIRLVYASTFSSRARAYLENTPFSVEDEKMAVVIQEVVGQPHGTRFYPHFSGVGLSYNFYPVGPQQPEDGVVYLALGLGHTIATGGRSVRFCPAYPEILPHLARPGEFLKYSQNRFYAVNLEGDGLESVDGSPGIFGALAEYDLAAAQEDGTLDVAASVYCRDDDQLRENSKLTGPRVVTFNNILKWRAIPLAEALNGLLRRLRQSMGSPVEIEFAVDMGDWGRAVATGQEHRGPCLYLLQVRPLAEPSLDVPVKAGSFPPAAVLCRSNRSLGHGVIGDMRDIIYVKGQILDPGRTRAVAEQVGRLNSELRQREAPYLLIGPGRWGSSDPSLGIPVDTWQITGARVIVEVPFEDREVEPSQGSHFFHELTSMHIGYLYVSGEGQDLVDWEWLSRQPAASETEEVRHVRLEEPLTAYLDGRLRQATILKPGGRGESYPGAACVGEATEAAPARR
ncbi:MAG TPA: DUF5752 family protein, partial [Candidatus Nitrosotenuis sp.]|nr:DUF5752 family protein [Candidatus Nitrosotenuis sp.]